MYGPSGPARHCYQHHVEAGGALSPFAGRKKAVSDSAPVEGLAAGAQVEPVSRRVIRRRKGEELTTGAAAKSQGPEAAENPPLSGRDEGLRRVEAKLMRKKA
jgi:hypothetical protein